MHCPFSSRTLLFACLSLPFVVACSGAPPVDAGAPAVGVAPLQGAAAPTTGVNASGQMNGGARTVQPPMDTATPNPTPPPPASGPAPDRDADGVPDSGDRCPDVPEDRDGFEDADGCPEPDNDKDGIADMNDQCPNQPETKNGRQDEDGCPD